MKAMGKTIHLYSFSSGDCIIRAREPFSVSVEWNKAKGNYIFKDSALGIEITSDNEEDIIILLSEELSIMWDQYVDEDTGNFSKEDFIVRDTLLRLFVAT